MNRIRNLVRRLTQPASSRFVRWLGRPDFLREVGDLADSSLVAAVLLWIGRTFPEAPPMLEQINPSGVDEAVRDHPMLRLMQKPNTFYTGVILWMATVIDWAQSGDGYWIVLPSASGEPAELWWAPSWMMEPQGDAGNYISHYDYTVEGKTVPLPPEQVIHFRYGLDPERPRHGMSPLRSVLREVFTDNEAAMFTAAILKNMGVPGVVISPGPGDTIDVTEAQQTKRDLQEKFSGRHRGEPLVMTTNTTVAQFGFSPDQLLLKELRRIPEERVSAVTGVPAIVVGFGAGLERSTFTNMGEARTAAYEGGLIPMQRILAEEIRFQLLVLFNEDPFEWRFLFDLTKVRVFQEDMYKLAQRHDLCIRGGWEMVSEGRRAMDLPVADDGSDDIYLRPQTTVMVPSDGSEPISLQPPGFGGTTTDREDGSAAPAAPANGNGHGDPAQARAVADEVIAAMQREELMRT